jgi:NADH:ubiquinone oxidoreductase subunit 3 (subunit A)
MVLDPFVALGIVAVFIIGLCVVGVVVYKVVSGNIKKESKTSMLQDKYRSERDSGEFKRNI